MTDLRAFYVISPGCLADEEEIIGNKSRIVPGD